MEQYLGDVELYKQIAPLTGSQFRCLGVGYPESKYGYDYRDKSMEREGQPATVVMDDIDEDDGSPRKTSSGSMTSNKFWLQSSDEDGDEDDREGEDEAEGSVVTPVHPYVQVFDLQQHGFVLVHVRNLTSYVYDKSAADKLVLSRETKNLITILVNGSAEVLEDIIKGKTGGTIVIATGPPGTGKTLTAEVFAEEIERPLYVVQCSQLGTDEAALEKALSRVLTRASRWKAILLIDEADVYVHERGQDIQQNAIVGVFLRVLEYYRGVLFLTSNRATVIDKTPHHVESYRLDSLRVPDRQGTQEPVANPLEAVPNGDVGDPHRPIGHRLPQGLREEHQEPPQAREDARPGRQGWVTSRSTNTSSST